MVIQYLSDNRSFLRLCIYVLSQIVIIAKASYASTVVGVLVALSVIISASHLHCLTRDTDAKLSAIMKHGKLSILFSILMLLIWIFLIV